MAQGVDVIALVKRVVGRAMAEQGRTDHPRGRPEVAGLERPAGVHVTIEPEHGPDRPAGCTSCAPKPRGAELVTARDLADVPDGGMFRVAPGVIVTDLARDEAWRRRIRIEERATADPGRLRIALAADHGGFRMKGDVADLLRSLGHEVFDHGTRDESPVDYPDFARAVAEAVASGAARFGIAIDGAGIGSAMAANKVPGVRAANCWDEASAKNAREHNYANVLTLGAKMLSTEKARAVVRAFLATAEGEERHGKRVAKIDAIERRYARG